MVSDTLASVLRSDPNWSLLPADVPAHVRGLLARCLERDVTRRLRDIGEARLVLGGGSTSPTTSTIQLPTSQIATASSPPAASRPWPWIAATALTLAALAAILPTSSLFGGGGAAPATDGSYELAIAAPPGAEFQVGANSGNVILAPDGGRIAFVASTDKAPAIWVRSLAADDSRSIPGTENATNPFWAPDGRSLGFFASGKLWTVKIAGGLPEAIATSSNGRGGAWNEDGIIIFSQGGAPLSRVAATGGAVAPQTTLDLSRGENAHYWPVFLPGGKRFIYFVRSTQVENGGIYLGHMDGSAPLRLVPSLSSGIIGRHPISGAWYLMWVRDDDLLAQAFNVESGALSGEIQTIARGVRVEESQRLTYASASMNGQLAWATSRASEHALALYARDGRRIRMLGVDPGKIVQPALSPDGKRLLFTRVERGGADIYMHDLTTNVTERLTTDPDYDEAPNWTPDGRSVTYIGRQNGLRCVLRLTIGGGAAPEKIYEDPSPSVGYEGPDRRFVILSAFSNATADDVIVRQGDGTIVPLLKAPGSDVPQGMSVDGKVLMLLQSSGARSAVSVARLRAETSTVTLGQVRVVAENAQALSLRQDGREVTVVGPDGMVKAIGITPTADAVTIGATTTLFQAPKGLQGFAVGPDGQQFVIVESPFAQGQTLRILTHWEARLK
jgi:Tol biopolymer transport system component